ncbi:MAG: TlpA family protein disulfide reductase [Chloroflexi bacterium]|nr:TlpA family protein disulfide reductase [Chloroflexota bacterium]
MPVWQQFYERNLSHNLEIVAVALDAQGIPVARPYVDEANATFVNLIDREAILARLYGISALPAGWLLDENGVIRYELPGRFSIRRENAVQELEDQIMGLAPARVTPTEPPAPLERDAFAEGVRLLDQGRRAAALERWFAAVDVDPDNQVARKHVWQLLYPEVFGEKIDFEWQKRQQEREDAEGLRQANPIPAGW